MLGCRVHGGLGSIRDDDPAPRSGVDVDVVHADAGTPDDLEPLCALDESGIERRGGADDDRIELADDLGELGRRVLDDVEPALQEREPRVGDRLANEDRARRSDTRGVVVGLERSRSRHAPLDLGAALDQQRLDRRQRRRDVEHVVVADVPDAEHPRAELAVGTRDRDPEAVAKLEHELLRVDARQACGWR